MFNLQNFTYNNAPINLLVCTKTGELLFDASNVCNILGYERYAVNIVEKLDDDEKVLLDRKTFDPTETVGSPGAIKKWFLYESGLYKLILRSNKPEAKAFTRWITHEVLPAIRKTGGYGNKPFSFAPYKREWLNAIHLCRLAGKAGVAAKVEAAKMVEEKLGTNPYRLIGMEVPQVPLALGNSIPKILETVGNLLLALAKQYSGEKVTVNRILRERCTTPEVDTALRNVEEVIEHFSDRKFGKLLARLVKDAGSLPVQVEQCGKDRTQKSLWLFGNRMS